MPFVISSLGERSYGIWQLIGTFVGYYGLLDFGINSAVIRFVSRSIGGDSRDEIKLYVSSAFCILSVAGILIISLTLSIYFLSFVFIQSFDDAHIFSLSILILGLTVGITFPLRIFVGVLSANFRFDLNRYIEFCEIAIRTFIIIVLLKRGYGIIGLAYATVIVLFLRYVAQTFISFKIDPYLKLNFRWVRKEKVKEMGGYGFFTFLQSLSSLLRSRIDAFTIAAFINVTAVAFYSVALTLITYLTQFFYSALGVLFPVFSEKDGASDLNSIADAMEFLIRFTTVVSTFFGTITILYAENFLIRWLGVQFANTYIYTLILALPFVFSFGFCPFGMVLNTTGKHRLLTWIEFSHGCANLALSLALVNLFGATGVAWGTAIPAFIFNGFIIPFFGCKRIGLNFLVLWLKMLFTAFVSLLLILPIWFMLNSFIEDSYISLAKIVAVHFGVYALLGYFVLLPKRDSTRLRQIILNFIRKDRKCQA